MATTQIDIKGVFDTVTGQLTGLAGPSSPEQLFSSLSTGTGKSPKTSHATAVRIVPGTGPSYVQALTIAAGAVKSFDIQIPCPGTDFVAVRPIFANYNLNSAVPGGLVIGKAKVAPAPKHLVSTGTQMTWTSLTFSGSNTGTVPAATTNGSQIIPGILIADLLPLASIARTDGGSRALLRVRTLIDNTASGSTLGFDALTAPGAQATWNADPTVNGFQIGAYTSVSADLVTTTGDSTSCIETGSTLVCIGAIFYTSAASAPAVAVGDSLIAGVGSTAGGLSNGMMGWPARVTFVDAGLSVANWSCAGQNTRDTWATLTKYLAVHKPAFAFFKSWSPNDGTSQANFDSAWFYTLDMIEQCRNAGVVPVVLTSSPVNAHSSAINTIRLAQNSKTMALAGPGLIVVDTGSLVADPANPSQLLPAYSFDGLHLTDAGYAVQAVAIRAAIGF